MGTVIYPKNSKLMRVSCAQFSNLSTSHIPHSLSRRRTRPPRRPLHFKHRPPSLTPHLLPRNHRRRPLHHRRTIPLRLDPPWHLPRRPPHITPTIHIHHIILPLPPKRPPSPLPPSAPQKPRNRPPRLRLLHRRRSARRRRPLGRRRRRSLRRPKEARQAVRPRSPAAAAIRQQAGLPLPLAPAPPHQRPRRPAHQRDQDQHADDDAGDARAGDGAVGRGPRGGGGRARDRRCRGR